MNSLPYGQGIATLHERVATHASPEDLDRLMSYIRIGAREPIALMADRLGTGRPPEDAGEAERDEGERPPTREEVLAYADRMGELYHEGAAHRRHGLTPRAIVEDLAFQPVQATALDLIRSGYEDAALAWLMVQEGYPGHVAAEAIALIAPGLKGRDLTPVPFPLDDPDAFRALDPRERLLVRHGDATLFGTPLQDGSQPRIHTGSDLLPLAELRQAWRLVPHGGEAHRAHLAARLSGLTGGDGTLRPGMTIEAVVAALVADGR